MKTIVADIGGRWPLDWFEDQCIKACQDFPFEIVGAITGVSQFDADKWRAHYPWIAFAAAGYRRQQAQAQSREDMRPADAVALLKSIADGAQALDADLETLDTAVAAAAAVGNRPKFLAFARAQRTVIDAFSEGGYGEWPSDEPDPCARSALAEWQSFLGEIAERAIESGSRLDGDRTARGGSGPRLRGLDGFVSVLADVWFSLSGRPPSTEKVQVAHGDSNPPFVRFVIAIADASGLPVPTRAMVRTALAPH